MDKTNQGVNQNRGISEGHREIDRQQDQPNQEEMIEVLEKLKEFTSGTPPWWQESTGAVL